MFKIPYKLRVLSLIISYPFRKTYVANNCRSYTKKTGVVTALGESFVMSVPLSENGSPDFCFHCIAEMSIRCAWCENPIHVGDPVTLYIPLESYVVPAHAVRYHEDDRYLVGCLGWDCAMSGADRQGFWVPPGKVHRVPSPIEMLLSAGSDCKGVLVKDVSNPNDLGKVIK